MPDPRGGNATRMGAIAGEMWLRPGAVPPSTRVARPRRLGATAWGPDMTFWTGAACSDHVRVAVAVDAGFAQLGMAGTRP